MLSAWEKNERENTILVRLRNTYRGLEWVKILSLYLLLHVMLRVFFLLILPCVFFIQFLWGNYSFFASCHSFVHRSFFFVKTETKSVGCFRMIPCHKKWDHDNDYNQGWWRWWWWWSHTWVHSFLSFIFNWISCHATNSTMKMMAKTTEAGKQKAVWQEDLFFMLPLIFSSGIIYC